MVLLSIVGYSFQTSEKTSQKKVEFNGNEFVYNSGYWRTNFQDNSLIFLYNPLETNSTADLSLRVNDYLNKPLYIYSENSDAEVEIYRNLQYFITRVQYACPEGFSCSEEFPIKSCEDNLIIIEEAESSGIKQQNHCIFIQGKEEDLSRLTDEVLYKIFNLK